MIGTWGEVKNGTFGRMTDGDYFVVVDDLIVYKSGGYDTRPEKATLVTDTNYFFNYTVKYMYEGVRSFSRLEAIIENHVDLECYEKCVFDSVVKLTLSEIKKRLGIKNLEIVEE